MDIQNEIKHWLRSALDARPRGVKTDLARFMGVHPNVITKMLNEDPTKEARGIHIGDLFKMFAFFEERPPEIIAKIMGLDADLAKMIADADESELAALRAFLQTLSASKNKR